MKLWATQTPGIARARENDYLCDFLTKQKNSLQAWMHERNLPCRWERLELRLIRWVAWRFCRYPVFWLHSTLAMVQRDHMSFQHERWKWTTLLVSSRLSVQMEKNEKEEKSICESNKSSWGGESHLRYED